MNFALDFEEEALESVTEVPSVISSSEVNRFSERVQVQEYLKKINKFPILMEEEERFLLQDFFLNNNNNSGIAVLNSHLRLVVKIAMQYKRYHFSLMDLIAEGNLGLMKALKNFSLEKEVRFATYAILWIKASIREYLTKSFTSVKAITTNSQKRLLFGISKVKKMLGISSGAKMTQEEEEALSRVLNITTDELHKHEQMIYSLKETSSNDLISGEESYSEAGDFLSVGDGLESEVIERSRAIIIKEKINEAVNMLSPKESEIIKMRVLADEKATLAELSEKLGLSKERIRQIQESAMKKLKKLLTGDEEIKNLL